MSPRAAFRLLVSAMRVTNESERWIAIRIERDVMKFMSAQRRAFGAERMIRRKARLPIAEMQCAFHETERGV